MSGFFPIKPFTFHSLTFERPRSLSKSIWIGELPWQTHLGGCRMFMWHVFRSRWGKNGFALEKTHEKFQRVWPETSQCVRWASVFTPYKTASDCQGGKGHGGHQGRRLVGNAAEMQRQLGGASKGHPLEKCTKKPVVFFVGDTNYPVNLLGGI